MILDHETLQKIVGLTEAKKGSGAVLFDLTGLSEITDYCLIVTGNTSVQVKALMEHLEENLPEIGVPVFHTEGMPAAKWILMDCGGDLVIHIMTPDEREFYQLERLLKDAEVIEFESDTVSV